MKPRQCSRCKKWQLLEECGLAASEAWRETGRSSHVNTLCLGTQRYIVDGWREIQSLIRLCWSLYVREGAAGPVSFIATWKKPTKSSPDLVKLPGHFSNNSIKHTHVSLEQIFTLTGACMQSCRQRLQTWQAAWHQCGSQFWRPVNKQARAQRPEPKL